MKTKMTHVMRMELANAIRGRDTAATSKDKRRILEEFIAATGYHEKSAIRVLNGPSQPQSRQTRQRLPLYDEAARGSLVWRQEAVQRLIGEVSSFAAYSVAGNILHEAIGNKIT